MANLGYKTITNKKYEDIETLLGINLVAGTRYSIETTGTVYLCPKSSLPDSEEGFRFYGLSKFYYTAEEGVKLYVKTPMEGGTINIGD